MGEQCDQTHMGSVGSSQVHCWGQKRKRGWEEMRPEKTQRCSWKWKQEANWKGSVMKKGFSPSCNKTVSDFYFWGGSKITADGDCSHEIKRRLLLGRNVMTNLDSIFKSRDITSLTKVCLVKAVVFPVVMYGCESWTVKKAECWKIDAFELRCWRRLLRVPWTARRSN